jgi:O-antigen/teichoic acid export membrane protein
VSTEPGAGSSVARAVAWNTGVQIAGKAAVMGMGAVSIAIVTRYLGAEDYGHFNLSLTYTQMFAVLADVGIYTILVREMAKRPERSAVLVGNGLAIRVVLGIAAMTLAVGLALLLPYPHEVRVSIAIAGIAVVLGLANRSMVAVLQARLQMGRAVISETLGRATALGGAITVITLDLGLYAMVGSAAAGIFAATVITFFLVRRLVQIRLRFERDTWRGLFTASIPLGLALAINEIYFRADTFIISLSQSFEEVGWYALAYRVLELVAAFPGVFMSSLFPVLARYVAASDPRLHRAIQAASDVFVVAGVPIAVGGLLLAPDIIQIAGGDDFDPSITPLRILLFAGALAFVNGLFGYCLIAKDRQKSALWLNVVALSFNLSLNLVLVPIYGIDAAAAVTLASELLILGGSFLLMRRYFDFFPSYRVLVPVAASAAAMAGVLWVLEDLPFALLLPLGIVIYGAAALVTGAIDRADLKALRA